MVRSGGLTKDFWDRYDKLINILLKYGADPNVDSNEAGRTPLHGTVDAATSVQALQSLLDAGADPHARDEEGRTPLYSLTLGDSAYLRRFMGSYNSDCLKILLRSGADMHNLDNRGVPALSVDESPPNDTVSHYLDLGLNPKLPCSRGEPLLVHLAQRGDGAIDLVERVPKMAPETVHEEDQQGFTPLITASRAERLKVARLLLKNGAAEKINTVNKPGMTALDMYLDKTPYLPDQDKDFIQLMKGHGAITTRLHAERTRQMGERGYPDIHYGDLLFYLGPRSRRRWI